MNISAGLGVAVREFPLKTGFADYMLYADAKLIRVIEAKAEDHRLSEVDDAYLLAFMKRYNGRFLFLSEDELRLWWPSWLESQPPPGLELVEKSKGAVVYERKEP